MSTYKKQIADRNQIADKTEKQINCKDQSGLNEMDQSERLHVAPEKDTVEAGTLEQILKKSMWKWKIQEMQVDEAQIKNLDNRCSEN